MRKWGSLSVAAGLLLILAPAAAGAQKTAPTGTLTMVSGSDNLRAAAPQLGGEVVFEATFTGTRKQDAVRLQVLCMQDGGVVYGEAHPVPSSPMTDSFTLGANSRYGTSVWTEGTAMCRADLYSIAPNGTTTFLANVPFDAAG